MMFELGICNEIRLDRRVAESDEEILAACDDVVALVLLEDDGREDDLLDIVEDRVQFNDNVDRGLDDDDERLPMDAEEFGELEECEEAEEFDGLEETKLEDFEEDGEVLDKEEGREVEALEGIAELDEE